MMSKEKIRLLQDLPVAAEHGATKGRVFDAEVVPDEDRGRSYPYWQIIGDEGESVGVLSHEAEVIEDRA